MIKWCQDNWSNGKRLEHLVLIRGRSRVEMRSQVRVPPLLRRCVLNVVFSHVRSYKSSLMYICTDMTQQSS